MVTGFHVFHGVINGALRHIDPGILCGPQGHHLQYGYRDIRVTYHRTIPPSALVVLAGVDLFDGAIELASNGRRTGLPVQFRQRDGGNAVRVHILTARAITIYTIGADLIE